VTDEQGEKIKRAAERLVKARRLWLEAGAVVGGLFKQHAEAQLRESKLGAQLSEARRDLELAVYDVEGCRVCGEVVPEPFKLYCCGEHQMEAMERTR
jgi:hypothetical protein